MSAELLRRAADELRKHAVGCVINGPWVYRDRSDDPESYPWTVWAPKSKLSAGTGFAPGTAEYIALMQPAVALALADLLDTAAFVADGNGLVDDDRYKAEADLARTILREKP